MNRRDLLSIAPCLLSCWPFSGERFFGLDNFLLSSIITPGDSTPTFTLESLTYLYSKSFPSWPWLRPIYKNNDQDRFSFDLVDFLYFYTDMHTVSGDRIWLSLASALCEHILGATDESRFARGEIKLDGNVDGVDRYYQAPSGFKFGKLPVPGWSSGNGLPSSLRLRAQVLTDGQIIGGLAYFADYVLSHGIAECSKIAFSVFRHCSRVFRSHDSSWRTSFCYGDRCFPDCGSWFYPSIVKNGELYSSPLAFNHAAGAMSAAILLGKHSPEFSNEANEKSRAFLRFFRECLTRIDDRYVWPYSIQNPQRIEDINHGSYSLMFLIVAHNSGLSGVTRDELRRFARSFIFACSRTASGAPRYFIDGREGDASPADAICVAHLSYLGRIDPEFLAVATRIALQYRGIFLSYGRMLRGLASVLREQQQR